MNRLWWMQRWELAGWPLGMCEDGGHSSLGSQPPRTSHCGWTVLHSWSQSRYLCSCEYYSRMFSIWGWGCIIRLPDTEKGDRTEETTYNLDQTWKASNCGQLKSKPKDYVNSNLPKGSGESGWWVCLDSESLSTQSGQAWSYLGANGSCVYDHLSLCHMWWGWAYCSNQSFSWKIRSRWSNSHPRSRTYFCNMKYQIYDQEALKGTQRSERASGKYEVRIQGVAGETWAWMEQEEWSLILAHTYSLLKYQALILVCVQIIP